MMKKLFLPVIMSLGIIAAPGYAMAADAVDTGNNTWILMCAALVMLMTPGLAFFYAGMVSRKNVVSTLLQNYVALAIVGLLWVTVGYSLAFGEGNQWIGDFSMVMLNGVSGGASADGVPNMSFMAFQMMFACITPALITGAIAERVHFSGWIIFMALWSLFVYVPVAHWVWGANGWILAHGGLDFAGGLVVHLTAGVAGLIAALLYGKRSATPQKSRPNDVSMIMMGAGLLWFGWFGFNAGSALSAGHLASHAFVTTFVGASAAFLSWMAVDWIKDKKPSAVGAAIGLVVGLVTITPAAGFVSVGHAILMCAVSGVVCNLFAAYIKNKTHLDDALDVFACHGIGGALGAIMTGLFASKAVNSAIAHEGILISGETELFIANLTGLGAVAAYTAIVTFILIKIIGVITPIRVTEEEESAGLDTTVHGEVARFHDRRTYE